MASHRMVGTTRSAAGVLLVVLALTGAESPALAKGKATTFTSRYAGAVVFRDRNRNGLADGDEAQQLTRDDGRFKVPKGKGRLYLRGGTEIATGQANGRLLTMPAEARAITTLSTVYRVLLDRGAKRWRANQWLQLPEGAPLAKLSVVPGVVAAPQSPRETLRKRDAQYDVLVGYVKSLSNSGTVKVRRFTEDAVISALAGSLAALGEKRVNVTDPATVNALLTGALQRLGISAGDLGVIAQAAAELNGQIKGLSAPLEKIAKIRAVAEQVITARDFARLAARFTGAGLIEQIQGDIEPGGGPTSTPTPTPTFIPTPTPLPTATPVPTPTVGALINDTGITGCSNADFVAVPCPVTGYPGQDAEYGRDVTHNGDADGHAGFSYGKIAADGSALPLNAAEWACIQDQVTGLIWEVKTGDGALRDGSLSYTNYSPGYDPYLEYGTASDAAGFVAAVNAQGLCGAADWRLPTVQELQTLLDSSLPGDGEALLDRGFFPNSQGSAYVSASPFVDDTGDISSAWYVYFDDGSVTYDFRETPYAVRLVRGAPRSAPRYSVSADGKEVTDARTGLIWRRCAQGMRWNGKTCTGDYTLFEWRQALQQAADEAKRTGLDWRLPNRHELVSLVDYAIPFPGPATDAQAFPETPADAFWSASPSADDSTGAWYVDFTDGSVYNQFRDEAIAVRLVRGGQ